MGLRHLYFYRSLYFVELYFIPLLRRESVQRLEMQFCRHLGCRCLQICGGVRDPLSAAEWWDCLERGYLRIAEVWGSFSPSNQSSHLQPFLHLRVEHYENRQPNKYGQLDDDWGPKDVVDGGWGREGDRDGERTSEFFNASENHLNRD